MAVCDLLLDESVHWLWPGAKAPPVAEGEGRNPALLERYAAELAELAATELSTDDLSTDEMSGTGIVALSRPSAASATLPSNSRQAILSLIAEAYSPRFLAW